MGYIAQTVELDAILTKRGRELLTSDPDSFDITKFALSDDEVDYRLWNPSHSLGTDYYGELIENTPVIEPLPGPAQQAKFRLITLPKYSTAVPQLFLGIDEIILEPNQEFIITPQSIPNKYNLIKGYTGTVWDWDPRVIAGIITETYIPGQKKGDVTGWITGLNMPMFGSRPVNPTDGSVTLNAIGMTFKLVAGEYQDDQYHSGTVTVYGNETGAKATFKYRVKGVNMT